MLGTVTYFAKDKGYGFIVGDDNQKYFVHFSEIKMDGYKVLKDGDKVEFMPSKNERGLCAMSVVAG